MTTETDRPVRRAVVLPITGLLLLAGACTGTTDEHAGMAHGTPPAASATPSSPAVPTGSSSATGSLAGTANSYPEATVIAPGRPGEPNSTLSGSAAVPPSAPLASGDVTYLQDMIVHHSQAIEMVDITRGRLQDTQVASLAARIGAEQQPEMQGMAQWLTRHGQQVPKEATMQPGQHGGHDMSGHAGMPGMATAAQLDALRVASPEDVDRQFLTLMIRHHEGAISMVVERSKVGTDPTVELLANDTAAGQQVQIDQMRAMLARLG